MFSTLIKTWASGPCEGSVKRCPTAKKAAAGGPPPPPEPGSRSGLWNTAAVTLVDVFNTHVQAIISSQGLAINRLAFKDLKSVS